MMSVAAAVACGSTSSSHVCMSSDVCTHARMYICVQVLLCEALEDIHKGRELIWDYGEGYWKQLQILEMMSPVLRTIGFYC